MEELTLFMDEFNHHIFDMISNADLNEKKGAILAIGMCKSFYRRFTLKNDK